MKQEKSEWFVFAHQQRKAEYESILDFRFWSLDLLIGD